MLIRAYLGLAWLVVLIVGVALTALLLAFWWLCDGSPLPSRRRPPYVARRIPGRLVRLEDLDPRDQEVLQGFRRTA